MAGLCLETLTADVLICDLGLPGVPGDRFIAQFRELNRDPKARVVIISGQDMLGSLATKLGADAFMRKPINVVDLRMTIQNELRIKSIA